MEFNKSLRIPVHNIYNIHNIVTFHVAMQYICSNRNDATKNSYVNIYYISVQCNRGLNPQMFLHIKPYKLKASCHTSFVTWSLSYNL